MFHVLKEIFFVYQLLLQKKKKNHKEHSTNLHQFFFLLKTYLILFQHLDSLLLDLNVHIFCVFLLLLLLDQLIFENFLLFLLLLFLLFFFLVVCLMEKYQITKATFARKNQGRDRGLRIRRSQLTS